jgi:hypothetical protein
MTRYYDLLVSLVSLDSLESGIWEILFIFRIVFDAYRIRISHLQEYLSIIVSLQVRGDGVDPEWRWRCKTTAYEHCSIVIGCTDQQQDYSYKFQDWNATYMILSRNSWITRWKDWSSTITIQPQWKHQCRHLRTVIPSVIGRVKAWICRCNHCEMILINEIKSWFGYGWELTETKNLHNPRFCKMNP